MDPASVPCPSPDQDLSCRRINLGWQSTSGAGTWFRIYQAWTLEGGRTCADVANEAGMILETAPDATSGEILRGMATGGGAQCLWITAVNAAGESQRVAGPGV